jgi:hypothetical protein
VLPNGIQKIFLKIILFSYVNPVEENLSNLFHHLRQNHSVSPSSISSWLKANDLFNAKSINSSEFSQSEIDLICFFISANLSVRQIDNEYFSNLMRKVLHKPSAYQFRTNFLVLVQF